MKRLVYRGNLLNVYWINKGNTEEGGRYLWKISWILDKGL